MHSERVDGPPQQVAPPFESRARHSGRQRSEGGSANQPTSRSGELSHRREADTWRPPPRLPIREDTRHEIDPFRTCSDSIFAEHIGVRVRISTSFSLSRIRTN